MSDDNAMAEKLSTLKSQMRVTGSKEATAEGDDENTVVIPDVDNSEVEEQVNEVDLADDGSVPMVDEDLEEDEEEDDEDGATVLEKQETFIVNLPKRNCMRCQHLMPQMPDKFNKKALGKEFDCYTLPECPAREIQMLFNPFTDEDVSKAVTQYKKSGDIEILNKLYEDAGNISAHMHEELHGRIIEMIKE